MEMMAVIVIVGLIAGIAIPNFQQAIDKQYIRDGKLTLNLLLAAQIAYKERYGQYLDGDLTQINSKFNLNISSDYWFFKVFDDDSIIAQACRPTDDDCSEKYLTINSGGDISCILGC